MNVLCWNCQGSGNPGTVNALKGLVALNHPTILFLCETRRLTSEVDWLRREIGFECAFAVDCEITRGDHGNGRRGGLALLWRDDCKVVLKSYSDHHIDVIIGEFPAPDSWRFTGIYGWPNAEDHMCTWDLIRSLHSLFDLPGLLGGDSNEILLATEKEGGNERGQRQMDDFNNLLDDCHLKSMDCMGVEFTWKGNRHGHLIKERLDRFVANAEWMSMFPAAKFMNHNPSRSDHVPISVDVRKDFTQKQKRKRRFMFEQFWLQDEQCMDVIRQSWIGGDELHIFAKVENRLARTRQHLLNWSKEKFGALKREIEQVRDKLSLFYEHADQSTDTQLMVDLEARLRELMDQEEAFWKQRAKVLWLTEGDRNTSYFQHKATVRKKKNTIKGLFGRERTLQCRILCIVNAWICVVKHITPLQVIR